MAEDIEAFIKRIPPVAEVRERLTHNLREARLLRQVIKLAEQRDRVRAVEPRENKSHA